MRKTLYATLTAVLCLSTVMLSAYIASNHQDLCIATITIGGADGHAITVRHGSGH